MKRIVALQNDSGRPGKTTLRALFLGRAPEFDELRTAIGAHAEIVRVENLDAALQTLHSEPFDVVISRASDLIPFQGMQFSGQTAAVIDAVNHGVCLVGPTGEMVWSNPKMLSFPPSVRERVCQYCLETFHWAEAEARAGSSQVRGRRFRFKTEDPAYFDITATPVFDLRNRVTQVAAVVLDVTSAKRLQSQIDAIDQAGRELVSLDTEQWARLDAQGRLNLLEEKILRCTRDLLHFDNFEIRVLDRKTNRLELVLASGMPTGSCSQEIYACSEGNGICGYVAARGRSYICPDAQVDPRYLPGLENAQSSLTVPLRLHDRVVGVANFESIQPAAFSEDDRQFAEIFGRYVALALHILELLVTEMLWRRWRQGWKSPSFQAHRS